MLGEGLCTWHVGMHLLAGLLNKGKNCALRDKIIVSEIKVMNKKGVKSWLLGLCPSFCGV